MPNFTAEEQKILTEVINLAAIQELPKGTEHFISDLHGEYEAFEHILRNGSGSIREKVRILFQDSLSEMEQRELCFIIYYPEEMLQNWQTESSEWQTLMAQLVKVTRFSSSKYTRSKVRKALPANFAYILEELLYQYDEDYNKAEYYQIIFDNIISLGLAADFCIVLAYLIQRFVVDHLHVLGDIFDRGPAPDKIIQRLMSLPSLDIQLGNHDILWIGAYSGSLPCLTNVLRIAARYGNLDLLQKAYGIDLTRVLEFSRCNYQPNPAFMPKVKTTAFSQKELQDAMLLQQAFAMMQFKVEGQVIERRPEFQLDQRQLLEKLNLTKTSIHYFGEEKNIVNGCFQLVDCKHPYQLTVEEDEILQALLQQFQSSKALQEQLQFLVEKGTLYQKYNGNLLFHGCLPCDEKGNFLTVQLGKKKYQGLALMDFFQECITKSFAQPTIQDDLATDGLWYLWCGEGSSLFGKKTMKTFERYFLADKSTHKEIPNAYYALRNDEAFCEKILTTFGLKKSGHIINGHTPVKVKKGETPIKAHGKMLVIDGGLSEPYQKVTGIAGYTLLANSFGMTLVAHQPFVSKVVAINRRQDILSQREIVVRQSERVQVKATDIGQALQAQSQKLMNSLKRKS
ncbi:MULTISPECIES: fructose-1,6-bisphosphatase [unclassified Enterococcus]|uniref:fructose-1,6-bisphosphatase n=1 Tax=unclassified Enterococcus TaxID=2608891 RepID=UPI002475BEE7|nr:MULTISPECIES: fructose-1,6-bisphosphatase [unclassified Enterococcus]